MSKAHDSLGDRMKVYESVYKPSIPNDKPLIIRLDGKAFSTYTRSLKKNKKVWDDNLNEVMDMTALELCKQIQGARFAYIQSDEISILVNGYVNSKSQPWYGNDVQKIISISAAIASATFTANSYKIWADDTAPNVYKCRPAYFDSRVLSLPEEEVNNYMIWRLRDCRKNSVSNFALSFFSHKQLVGKTTEQRKEMLKDFGHDWDLLPSKYKNGRVIVLRQIEEKNPKFFVETDFPLFWEDKNYILGHFKPKNK